MARVVIIDDDPDILDTVARVLHTEYHDVMVAANGTQGIQTVKTNLPDLVLCDISMPITDGYAVYQAIRNDPKTNAIPFVFLTARGSRADHRKGMELGADDYLIKPFSARELLSCVRTQIVKHNLLTDRYEKTLSMVRKNIMYALPHELRTPLSQIIGYAGLLEMENDPVLAAGVRDYGARITKASQRLEHLIENYLVYAQIEIVSSSADELEKLRNNLIRDTTPIIEKAVQTRATYHNREKDVTCKVTPSAMRISANDLDKITSELVDNALKFSKRGTAVTVEGIHNETNYEIIIRDLGHGMTEAQISMLDAYIQFDRTFYEQQGVGLGFIITKRLVELYGGKILVESKVNQGTTVRVTFPF